MKTGSVGQERIGLALQFVSELMLSARLVSTSFLARSLNGELSSAAFAVLTAIQEEGPQSVPEIARSQISSRQNVQAIINRLLACGNVEAVSNPGHKRSPLFTLTDAGRSVLEGQKTQEMTLLETKLVEALDGAELRTAVLALSRIRRLLAPELQGTPDRKGVVSASRKVTRPSPAPSPPGPPLTESTPTEPTELPYNLL